MPSVSTCTMPPSARPGSSGTRRQFTSGRSQNSRRRYNDPMRRRLLTLISVGSLLLCVAVCVLWVRSYWASDTLYVIRWEDEDQLTFLTEDVYEVGRGGIGFSRRVESGDRGGFRTDVESGRKAR